jgi:putative endonuclease
LQSRLQRLVRIPYVYFGTVFDRYYEEMPWRRRISAGQRGEQVAARHLKRAGYIILARNYRVAGAEIDLIALDDDTLVFVEVKARGGGGFGLPQEAVNYDKRERIRRAALVYVERRGVADVPARFDVVAIHELGRHCKLELVKDAF